VDSGVYLTVDILIILGIIFITSKGVLDMSRVIDSAFEFSAYPFNVNELITEVLQEKLTEITINTLYKEYIIAMQDYKKGKVKTGTVKDLFNSIK
jgi:hypothetical protein